MLVHFTLAPNCLEFFDMSDIYIPIENIEVVIGLGIIVVVIGVVAAAVVLFLLYILIFWSADMELGSKVTKFQSEVHFGCEKRRWSK